MSRFLVLAGLSVLVMSASALPSLAQTNEFRLKDLQDKARPVIVLSDERDDPRVMSQVHALDKSRSGVAERDIKVVREAKPGSALRKTLGVAETGFAVVLVGKDGSVKKVWREPVDPKRIFTIIDAMPMRRDEMRG